MFFAILGQVMYFALAMFMGQLTIAGEVSSTPWLATDQVSVTLIGAGQDTWGSGEATSTGASASSRRLPPLAAAADNLVDFNGDGYGDLAIGIPGSRFAESGQYGGEVLVMYGRRFGLSRLSSELWDQATAGSTLENNERFGFALAAADFNGDGHTDLAVGSPYEQFGNDEEVGQVNIIYGTASGLIAGVEQVIAQFNPSINGVGEERDRFGFVLEGGDFNGDGHDDLAIGVPYEDYEAGGIVDMGAVNIVYGSPSGLTTVGDQILHPALPDVEGFPTEDGWFGYALDVGDFDGDGKDDLAVGIPGYYLDAVGEVGAVQVFYGSSNGLSLLGEQLWYQGHNGLPGNPEPDDFFGVSLAAGDFDNNGVDDLAVGASGENIEQGASTVFSSGIVHVIYGYVVADGLASAGNQIFRRGLPGIAGPVVDDQFFGAALVAADFDGNGVDDLAVGVSGDSITAGQQGSVQVFYSNGAILFTANQDLWYQGVLRGAPEIEDVLGYSLGSADFNGDGYDDLAAGVPFEDVQISGAIEADDAGAVNLIYGSQSGLTRARNRIFHQQSPGIPGVSEESDLFGFALTR